MTVFSVVPEIILLVGRDEPLLHQVGSLCQHHRFSHIHVTNFTDLVNRMIQSPEHRFVVSGFPKTKEEIDQFNTLTVSLWAVFYLDFNDSPYLDTVVNHYSSMNKLMPISVTKEMTGRQVFKWIWRILFHKQEGNILYEPEDFEEDDVQHLKKFYSILETSPRYEIRYPDNIYIASEHLRVPPLVDAEKWTTVVNEFFIRNRDVTHHDVLFRLKEYVSHNL
ncbi:ORF53 [Plodia interpunctella granulovirus]|uniref:ORF53 n=1 Tax=Plodia interpunctella granulovirus TaxID=262175 RepID=A0A1L5JGZ2_9BBAC|nr:ORF53 [Plodia interpunctella granulovirus]APO13937.1 ORF53 [Plodia interpunctella granulovirus]